MNIRELQATEINVKNNHYGLFTKYGDLSVLGAH